MDIVLRDYQQEAVDAVFQAMEEGVRRQLVVLPTGSGKCIRGDMLVATNEGFRPIEAIAGGLEPGSVRQVDLQIWNPEGIFRATHLYSDGIRPTIKITTSRGYELEGTPQHRILCLVDGRIEWRFLKDIGPGMQVVLGRGVELFASTEAVLPGSPEYRTCATHLSLPARIDVDLAEWLGLLAADGGLSVRDWVTYAKADERLLDRVAARMEMLGLNPRRVAFPSRAPSIVVSSRSLVRWLEAAGLAGKSCTKQVPWPVFLSPPEVAAGFLRGLFTGDAYIQSDR
ncbi:MAG: DEAD/DEAH box helicase family protein, partial [Moorellales bacterium]